MEVYEILWFPSGTKLKGVVEVVGTFETRVKFVVVDVGGF